MYVCVCLLSPQLCNFSDTLICAILGQLLNRGGRWGIDKCISNCPSTVSKNKPSLEGVRTRLCAHTLQLERIQASAL